MTWHPEEGQPGPGRGLAILALVLAFVLVLTGAAILYVELAARSGAPLPPWIPGALPTWLAANGLPLVAAGAIAVGLLGLLVVRGASREAVPPPVAPPVDDGTVERLRRQIEPLATGDLAVWLPEAEGALGEINRTLNLLVGGVSDLVAAADEASVRLLGAIQDGRGGLAGLKVEAERGRQLADDVLERARHALSATRALGGPGSARQAQTGAVTAVALSPLADDLALDPVLAGRLDGIVEVVSDLAEQAHVLAVGISVQAAAADAPPALRVAGDDVRLLAEQAGRAVGRIGPLVRAALQESLASAPDPGLPGSPERAAGASAAGRRVADQVAALAELAAGLRAALDRVVRAQDEAAASLGILGDLAHRLRRATGRFRLPG